MSFSSVYNAAHAAYIWHPYSDAYRFRISPTKAFILDSVYQSEKYRPPFIYDYRSLYQTHALCLIKLGRNDEAVEILDKGVDFIIAQEKDFNKKIELDIPVFPGTAFSYGFKGNTAYGKSIDKIQSLFLNDAFSILNDLPSYQKLVDRVNCLKS